MGETFPRNTKPGTNSHFKLKFQRGVVKHVYTQSKPFERVALSIESIVLQQYNSIAIERIKPSHRTAVTEVCVVGTQGFSLGSCMEK